MWKYKKMALKLFEECLCLAILYDDLDLYNKLLHDYPVLEKEYDRYIDKYLKEVKIPPEIALSENQQDNDEKILENIKKRVYGNSPK